MDTVPEEFSSDEKQLFKNLFQDALETNLTGGLGTTDTKIALELLAVKTGVRPATLITITPKPGTLTDTRLYHIIRELGFHYVITAKHTSYNYSGSFKYRVSETPRQKIPIRYPSNNPQVELFITDSEDIAETYDTPNRDYQLTGELLGYPDDAITTFNDTDTTRFDTSAKLDRVADGEYSLQEIAPHTFSQYMHRDSDEMIQDALAVGEQYLEMCQRFDSAADTELASVVAGVECLIESLQLRINLQQEYPDSEWGVHPWFDIGDVIPTAMLSINTDETAYAIVEGYDESQEEYRVELYTSSGRYVSDDTLSVEEVEEDVRRIPALCNPNDFCKPVPDDKDSAVADEMVTKNLPTVHTQDYLAK